MRGTSCTVLESCLEIYGGLKIKFKLNKLSNSIMIIVVFRGSEISTRIGFGERP